MKHDTILFGSFRLDTDPDRLRQGSEEVPLRAKSLSVLAYLARRPGRLVTKDELREQVWGATHVSDTTLRVTVREIRAALGDDTTDSSHLETVPGRGYRFLTHPQASSDLESAASQMGDRPPAGQGEPIVGRREEVDYLLNRFREADKGRRQLVFVAGEPGAGKSTLVRLFMERLAARPGTTLVGSQCVMGSGVGEAYGPVLEALGRLVAEPAGGALVRLLDRCAPMWLAQLPAVVESADLERLQRRVEGATQERMVRELNDLLERMTQQATLVLVLEDLHWSDVATVQLLTSIAQRPEAARLLILGTYRPADAVVSAPALGQAIHELEGHRLCEHLDVEMLTRRDVGAYAAARLGATYSEDAADQVFQRSRGNALFMVNVLDHLMQAGAIRKLDGRWSVDTAAEALSQVPEGLRPFIQCRLDMLSAAERRTLETASVVGLEFVAAALPQDPESAEAELEGLSVRTRLIEDCGVKEWPDGTLSGGYRFHHALYRKCLYEEIPEARRAKLHRMIGEHLRAAYGPEHASMAPVLAVHFENGRDAESAARYRRMAGQRALGRHGYHEAATHFAKALDAFDQARIRPADGDPEDRVRWELEVCTALGNALIPTRGHSNPEVEKVHSRARSLIDRLDDPAAQLTTLFNLWSFSTTVAELAESADLVTRMSELTAGTENDELALMSHSARARTCLFRGEFAESADSVRQVLTLYDPLRHGDEPGVIGLGVETWLLWLQGYPAQAATRMREACELAERLDDSWARAFAWCWTTGNFQFRGDTAQLDRQAREMQRLSAEHGFPLWIAWATIFEGWVAGARANEADGIALMERGLEAWRGAGARIGEPYFLVLLSETCLRAGRIEAASERLAEARAQVENSGERWWEAELHRLEGEVLLAAADDGGRDGDSSDRAEACFHSALEVARRQQARSLELRAALSLSRLWSRSRRDEARLLLGGVLETFTEGHDTADLRAASEQMARLSPAD
jgi:DNA-binding winged helix-turn-helix (wHTH) protein/tetratricopeptide (TPR) repeat protein